MNLVFVGKDIILKKYFLNYLSDTDIDIEKILFFDYHDINPLIEIKDKEFYSSKISKDIINNISNSIIIFFGDKNITKKWILIAEKTDNFIIDGSGAFINETTVNNITSHTEFSNLSNNLFSIPNLHVLGLQPIITLLDERFNIKRLSIDISSNDILTRYNDFYTDDEIEIINQISSLCVNPNIRTTICLYSNNLNRANDYKLNFEFARPINTDVLESILNKNNLISFKKNSSEYDFNKIQVKRDLSFNSGLHLWIKSENLLKTVSRILYNSIKKMNNSF